MNFGSEVGKKLNRILHQFTPRGGMAPRLNFGVDFQKSDALLCQVDGAASESGSSGSVDMVDVQGRQVPRFKSMRIYHISGVVTDGLVGGDEWEVEVVKCYLNPDEARTGDNRRKIHYAVKPIRRIERIEVLTNIYQKIMVRQHVCGRNRRSETIPCEVFERTYRLEISGRVVIAYEAMLKGEHAAWGAVTPLTADEFMKQEHQRLSGGGLLRIEMKRVRGIYNVLPLAPPSLLEHMFPKEDQEATQRRLFGR